MMFAKHVLCWIVILCCWWETQAIPSVYMQNRTRVALAGEKLEFSLTVTVPANVTDSLHCYCLKSKRSIWHKELKCESRQSKQIVVAHITMHNSSSSGKYYFQYGKYGEVHWVVQVRDKGYEEPPDEVDTEAITMMAFAGVLLIFCVTGSLYILKNYMRQRHCRDNRNEVAEQSPEENDNVILDEDAGSASLYTALQYKSESVYDTLNPDTVVVEERNTRKENSNKKQCKPRENEAFDSVYENLCINERSTK